MYNELSLILLTAFFINGLGLTAYAVTLTRRNYGVNRIRHGILALPGAKKRALLPVYKILALPMPAIVKDFKNADYANLWISEFAKGYSQYPVEKYLSKAKENSFAISQRECCDIWNTMIKLCKPASPTRPVYYKSDISTRTRPLTDAEIKAQSMAKPIYYGSKGYGIMEQHTSPSCGEDWINKHLSKYADGLPEQTITVHKLKKVEVSVLAEANKIVRSRSRRKVLTSV